MNKIEKIFLFLLKIIIVQMFIVLLCCILIEVIPFQIINYNFDLYILNWLFYTLLTLVIILIIMAILRIIFY